MSSVEHIEMVIIISTVGVGGAMGEENALLLLGESPLSSLN
jgi:hypothetical protein